MISEAALTELKLRNPVDQVAGRYVELRRHGRKMIGPCPLHSPDPRARDSTSFECDAEGFVCAVCQTGGDVIKLIMKREDVDFVRAVELLGGISEPDPKRAAEFEREQAARRERAERDNSVFRERERERTYEIWKRGAPLIGSQAELYLKARGIDPLPDGLKLRCIEDMPYYASGAKDAEVIHRGPCMLAPIVNAAGTFRALHMTWFDLTRPNGKALIKDPESGELLPSKKVRGLKAGNVIRLVDAPSLAHPKTASKKWETRGPSVSAKGSRPCCRSGWRCIAPAAISLTRRSGVRLISETLAARRSRAFLIQR